MFRLRLAAVIAISFAFVLFLADMLYQGTEKVVEYAERSQAAHDMFDDYERLSQAAYRYFKQRMDSLLIAGKTGDVDVELAGRRLNAAMQTLRQRAIEGGSLADPSKVAELERVAQFTAFLDACEYRYDEIERLQKQGKQLQAVQALASFSDQEIDGKFQPLIDGAIAAELENSEAARLALIHLAARSHWLAVIVSAAASLFGLIAGWLLLRGLKQPIEALMAGTHEIASGNLNHRIVLSSRDEFAFLASHFNQMALELKAQQDRLNEGRALLEKRVGERTFELHQLNAELKRMDAERRAFLADISHELRTPITIIRGEAEVALRGADQDVGVYKDALARVIELSTQLGKYVHDLLFLARAETANLQFEWHSVDLTDLVASTAEDLQVIAAESGISITLDAADEPVWVRGDKQRLRQVLFILGDNACRYSRPGGQIALALWVNRSEVSFSIADQGIGIPSQDLEKIFDRHFRSQNALQLRVDGSGLGLAMAKSILKAHGGYISVTSAENAGSTFTVTLPRVTIEEEINHG